MRPVFNTCAARNRGFSLVELVVVLAILGLCGSAIAMTLMRQQRFYRGASEMLHSREGVRDALEVISSDIRGMSVSDTVRLMADSAMEFFATVGSSTACYGSTPGAVMLSAGILGRGNTLTSFAAPPDTGDVALVYRDSPDGGGTWERSQVLSIAAVSGDGCLSTDGVTPRVGYALRLSSPLAAAAKPGSPVRFLRRGRYSLYRSSDGDWYLGYRRCNAIGTSVCGAIQPLSGPYRPYSQDSFATGLLFEYFDRHGQRLASQSAPLDLARVQITARALSKQRILSGNRTVSFGDSGTVAITPRNE